MDIVFDDDNARVLRSVHDELISAVEDDVVAVARIECHQGVTTTNCFGPSGEMISKFKLRVVSDGVEIVVAVDQAGQTLPDDVEERVERLNAAYLGSVTICSLVVARVSSGERKITSRLCRLTRTSSAAASEGAAGYHWKYLNHGSGGNKPVRQSDGLAVAS